MNAPRGMSLIDVVVGCALILIVFVGLIGLLRASLLISGIAKARAGATAIAETQLEYVRGLDYDIVGTVGGIPAGLVAATSTQILNGVTYETRTLIVYVDDPKDGFGAADTNGIQTDYKQIKVEVSYSVRSTPHTISLISNYAPPGLETTTNGGTLSIAVVGATGAAVPGATVSIQNSATAPTVSFTTFSDSLGFVQLPGAPTSTEYRIEVSKDGYSSAQTYLRDATNQNPTPGYLTVAKGQTTTSTFAIDALAPFTLSTFSPIRATTTTDTFASATGLSTQSGTTVTGGSLRLATGLDGYELSGTARGVSVAPQYLAAWNQLTGTLSVPSGTSALVRVTDSAGALLPDAVLPGNSAGFSSFPISLAGVATSTYPALALSAALTTTSTTTTSQILDWAVSYDEGPIPLPNVAFTLTGAKRMGTTGAGAPIYKTVIASTTGASAVFSSSLEWDVYTISGLSLTVLTASSTPTPFTVDPGTAFDATLILE
ncbi:MAG: carboxypeptidase-like regulatory domain-containing protein [Patescibacteria group bacterium]